MYKYSVIIPVKDDPFIVSSIESFLAGATTYANVECIVVCNGSHNDFVSNLIARFKHATNVNILTLELANISCSRNLGIKHAKGDYIVFMDSDNYIPANYFDVLENHIGSADIIMGDIAFETDNSDKFTLLNKWFHHHINNRSFNHYLFSPNLIVKKTIFFDCGGFDPKLSGSEDGDWSARVTQLNKYTYKFVPELIMHNVPERFIRRRKSWVKYGYGYAYRSIRELKYKRQTLIQSLTRFLTMFSMIFSKQLTLEQRFFCCTFMYHFTRGVCKGVSEFFLKDDLYFSTRENIVNSLPITFV